MTGTADSRSPYGDLTVVELAGDPAGEALGKLLATMGADVIKVELPEGAPSAGHRPGRGRRPGRRPGRQPELLVLQRRQAQRGARLPDRRRHRPAARPAAPGRHRDHRVAAGGMGGARHHPGRSAPRRARADRGQPEPVRAGRAVGRHGQLRSGRPGARRPAEQLRLRRPLHPADPPRRRSGLSAHRQLRPPGRTAGPARAPAHRPGTAHRRGHARLPVGKRRAGQPLLVLPPGAGAPADLQARSAHPDPAGPVRHRRRPLHLLRADHHRAEAVAEPGGLDGIHGPGRRPHRPALRRPGIPAGEFRAHPADRGSVLPAAAG